MLFDLDGVLYNTEPLRFKSYQILFYNKFGKKIPDNLIMQIVGKSERENFYYLSNLINIDDYDYKLFKYEREKILIDLINKYVSEDKSLINLLDNLIKFGFTVGLVSNADSKYIKFV